MRKVNRKELIELINNNGDYSCNSIDVSEIEDFSDLFKNKDVIHDITGWDVGSGIRFTRMFYKAKFNQPINHWDMTNVKSIYAMFKGSNFNQLVNDWAIDDIDVFVDSIFHNTRYNKPLNKWKINSVSVPDELVSLSALYQNDLMLPVNYQHKIERPH
jgi:hypothetical protein